jgi:GTP-binding protein HflX
VVDAADPAHGERIEQVNAVLREIGAGHLPLIQVYNKADILGIAPRVDRAETGLPYRVWLSAATGAGIELLPGVIAEYLHQDVFRGTVRLTVAQARARSMLYASGQVLRETELREGGWQLDVEMDRAAFDDLRRREHIEWEPSLPARGAESALIGRQSEVVASHGVE